MQIINKEAELLSQIIKMDWKPFTPEDYEIFGGVRSVKPLICTQGDLVYVIDDNLLIVVEEHDRQMVYMLTWQNEVDEEGYLV